MSRYSPQYLSSSYKSSAISKENKENAHDSANSHALLENLFSKLHYFSSSSKNFLRSAEKLSKHIVKEEPLAERSLKNYENEKRSMENSLDLLVKLNIFA